MKRPQTIDHRLQTIDYRQKVKSVVLAMLLVAGCWFLVSSFSGCAQQKTTVKKGKVIASKTYNVEMNPVIVIKAENKIKNILVGNFTNAGTYRAADVVFIDALRFKLQEKGFLLVEKEEEADLIMEGRIKNTVFKRKRGGFFKATFAYLASGEAARRYIAEIKVDFDLFAGSKKYATSLASRVITPESEAALAINEASIRLADALIGQIK